MGGSLDETGVPAGDDEVAKRADTLAHALWALEAQASANATRLAAEADQLGNEGDPEATAYTAEALQWQAQHDGLVAFHDGINELAKLLNIPLPAPPGEPGTRSGGSK